MNLWIDFSLIPTYNTLHFVAHKNTKKRQSESLPLFCVFVNFLKDKQRFVFNQKLFGTTMSLIGNKNLIVGDPTI